MPDSQAPDGPGGRRQRRSRSQAQVAVAVGLVAVVAVVVAVALSQTLSTAGSQGGEAEVTSALGSGVWADQHGCRQTLLNCRH